MKRRDVKIGRRTIGDSWPVFCVAETGTNHNGNIDIAVEMIEAAKRCGADAVKFQTIDADASYIKGTLPHKIYKGIRFTAADWQRLKGVADKKEILFFSAPADMPSVEVFKKVRLPVIKISSASMTNIALARKMAELRIPVMVSTGMSYISDIRKTISEFEKNGIKDLVILHCTSLYPAESGQLNLNAIKRLRDLFAYPIGYSDHSQSNIPSIAAVALGAKVVEKHFTIDRSIGGPEQSFSYTPDGLKRWIEDIRYTERALGSFRKAPAPKEVELRDSCRRCLVANVDIKKGDLIKGDMVGMKRPLARPGLGTSYFERVLGKRAKKDIKKNEPIYADSVRRL